MRPGKQGVYWHWGKRTGQFIVGTYCAIHTKKITERQGVEENNTSKDREAVMTLECENSPVKYL